MTENFEHTPSEEILINDEKEKHGEEIQILSEAEMEENMEDARKQMKDWKPKTK